MNSTSPSGYIHIKDYTLRYKLIRKYKDPLLGETQLHKDRNQPKNVLVKEKSVTTQEQFDNEINTCEFLSKLNNVASFTKFHGYTYKVHQTNKGDSCLFYEIREYVDNDLEKEVVSRLRNQSFFSEEELWRMTNRMVSAMAKLQYHNLYHTNIRPKNLLISKEGEFKIHWTNYHFSIYDYLISQNAPLDAKAALSPEILDCLLKENTEADYNPLFSDVFSLGLTILYAGALGDIDDIYDWNHMVVKPQRLNFKLSWLKATYSERLYKVLDRMLQLDPVKRSDFQSLLEFMHQIGYYSRSGGQYSSVVDMPGAGSGMPKNNSASKLAASENYPSSFKKKLSVESETVFEPLTTKGGSPKSPQLGYMTRASHGSEGTGVGTSGGHSLPLAVRALNLNSQQQQQNFMKSQKFGSPLSETEQVIREEEENVEETKTMTPRAREVPALLTRNFSPVKVPNQVDNMNILRQLQEQILYNPDTGEYRDDVTVKNYNDGSYYEGQFAGKMRSGYGIYHYQNGDIYAGGWVNDKFHGRGVYLFANGERYEGDLVNGLKQGRGVYYYTNKNKYLGDWKYDKKNGKGTFYFFASNETYDGEWEDGERHGNGTFFFATGDKFVGNWVKGEKKGLGTIFYNDGSKFEGEWRNNRPNGIGTMMYSNGDKYHGNWHNGIKNGFGTYYYPDGSKYEGEWFNDDKEGTGIFYYSKGDKFTGQWRNGLKNGKGVYEYYGGGSYEGDWEKDLKNGKGVLSLPDGTRYEGTWKDGERNGKGTLRLPNGDVYEGEFEHDMMNGKGKYVWGNGDIYEGQWLKNMMHGEGVLKNKMGEEFKGIWEYQKLVKLLSQTGGPGSAGGAGNNSSVAGSVSASGGTWKMTI